MPKTTVIVVAYNQTAVSAHMTMACLANIRKYTDPEEYQLWVVEDIPKFPIRDDYGVLEIDKHVILNEWTPFSQKVNMMVELADTEYVAIVQNDVFVTEGWLKNCTYYLEHDMADAIVPDQLPRKRQYMLDAAAMTMEEGFNCGYRDACMMVIRKEAFQRAGGYNPKMQVLVEGDFYERLLRAGVRLHTTNKSQITHITLATHYQDMEKMEEGMHNDGLVEDRLR